MENKRNIIDGETPDGMAKIMELIAGAEGRGLTKAELDMLHKQKMSWLEKRETGKGEPQISLGTGG